MACNRQKGSAPFCHAVADATGWNITQAEWHELRTMAQESGLVTTRQRADVDRVNWASEILAQEIATTLKEGGESEAAAQATSAKVRADLDSELADANVTRATVSIVQLLAEQGLKPTQASLRQRLGRARKKTGLTHQERWRIQDEARAEVEPLNDDDMWAQLEEERSTLASLPSGDSERELVEARIAGLMDEAADRGIADSSGDRFDAPDYTPKFDNSEFVEVEGTSRQGQLDGVSYYDLVRAFGEPTYEMSGDDDGDGKVQVMWSLEFESPEGRFAGTIYDWKSDDQPLHVTQWNVGGNPRRSAYLMDYIERVLKRT